MSYHVGTAGTLPACFVKLGQSSHNLTIQHLHVLISLALSSSSFFLNPLTDGTVLHLKEKDEYMDFHFVNLFKFCEALEMFLYFNFILQQYLCGGTLRDSWTERVDYVNIINSCIILPV